MPQIKMQSFQRLPGYAISYKLIMFPCTGLRCVPVVFGGENSVPRCYFSSTLCASFFPNTYKYRIGNTPRVFMTSNTANHPFDPFSAARHIAIPFHTNVHTIRTSSKSQCCSINASLNMTMTNYQLSITNRSTNFQALNDHLLNIES